MDRLGIGIFSCFEMEQLLSSLPLYRGGRHYPGISALHDKQPDLYGSRCYRSAGAVARWNNAGIDRRWFGKRTGK